MPFTLSRRPLAMSPTDPSPAHTKSTTPWALRCFPILSLFALLFLNFAVLGTPLSWVGNRHQQPPPARPGRDSDGKQGSVLQTVYAAYLLAMHILAFMCAVRLCWATRAVIREVGATRVKCASGGVFIGGVGGKEQVIHAVIIPSYKEDFDTLRSTLAVLASHPAAARDYHIIVATEERDPNAQHTTAQLDKVFADSFLRLSFTTHPAGIPGESPGKASNVNWAAKRMMDRLCESHDPRNVIFTVMDADTHLPSDYFTTITTTHLSHSPTTSSTHLYAPPLIFDRNATHVPIFVRVADIVWSGAGISGFHPTSTVCIPTSVYSLPLPLARAVGGWDTHAAAIGEDMHMFLKCFFATRGALRVVPVYTPASSSNVASALPGLTGWCDGVRARWRQALRHMWGSLDSGYAIHRGWQLLRERRANCNDEITQLVDGVGFGGVPAPRRRASPLTYLLLYHRLFEAHCLPMHLTLCIIFSLLYTAATPPTLQSPLLAQTFSLAATLRVCSLAVMGLWMALYHRYHGLAVRLRESEMRATGLYDEADFSRREGLLCLADILVFPVAGLMFSAPGLVAQVSHLWTDRLEYRVSAKPMRERGGGAGA